LKGAELNPNGKRKAQAPSTEKKDGGTWPRIGKRAGKIQERWGRWRTVNCRRLASIVRVAGD